MVKKRAGIGTVIASAVMVFLIVFTIAQLYSFNIAELDNYNQVAAQVFNTNASKQSEHLSITNAQLAQSGSNYMVTLTLQNTGGVTAHIVAVWIDDVDQSTLLHTRVSESLFLGQGLSTTLSSIDSGIPTTSLDKMTVRVFTELGNAFSVEVLPPGLAGTTSQTLATVSLIINPPNPITTNDISVVLTVTNNNALGAAFTNLRPDICLVQGTQTFPTPTPFSNCKTALTQCAGLSYPVTCSSISAFPNPTPASISFLPYGSTAVFQWLYLVNTIVGDSPVTVLASYESLSTSFYVSVTQPQAVYQTITVRNPGGASATSGGDFLTAFGSLVNYFNSFQASQSSGVWVIGTALNAGTATVFRMNVTNLSSNVIQFSPNSEILVLDSKTAKIYNFYIVQACTDYQPYYASNTSCGPSAYPAGGYMLGPAQTISLYFTGTIPGGTTEQDLGSSGESGQSWTATPAFFGSKFNGAGVTQPVGVTTASISINALVTGGMPTTPSAFTLVVQTGWNSGAITLSGGSCSMGGTTTTNPAVGLTVITGISSANCGSSFTMTFSNAPPSCTFAGSPPQCTAGGTTYFSNQYNTFTWGVYNTNTLLSTGGSIPYGQTIAVFSVRT